MHRQVPQIPGVVGTRPGAKRPLVLSSERGKDRNYHEKNPKDDVQLHKPHVRVTPEIRPMHALLPVTALGKSTGKYSVRCTYHTHYACRTAGQSMTFCVLVQRSTALVQHKQMQYGFPANMA